jgi:CRP-like cAMP-binding protein
MSNSDSKIENKLYDFFVEFDFLKKEDIEKFLSIAEIKHYKKKELLSTDKKDYNYYLVLKGIVHQYFYDSLGEMKTFHFAHEGVFIGAMETIYENLKTSLINETLEEATVLKIDANEYNNLLDSNARFFQLKNILQEKAIYDLYQRLHFMIVMNPEERYQFLFEHEPELIQRVPQKYIAHYIRVTPVSLSRIKARLLKK